MTYTAFPSETDPPATSPPTWPNATTAALRPSSPWANPAVCNRVKELWATNSASEIRDALKVEFGIIVSRNAVVGRLHRANLTIEQKTKIHPLTSSNYAPRVKPASKPRPERASPTFRPRVRHESPELKAMRCAEISPLNLTIGQLTDATCKWPYGDVGVGDGVTYCGHGPLKGFPYCPNHFALSVKPTRGA